jgi:hypothetical protein
MSKYPMVLMVLLAATVRVLHADSITLNNGKIISGEILSDSPDGILIEYYATSTIKDQKTFPRDDIVSVVKVPADEKGFKALGNLVSPNTLLDTSFCDELIMKIPQFLNNYPYSKHLAELRATLSTLEGERDRLRVGDRKIDGVWISADQISSDDYQLGAKIKYTKIKEQALEKNTLGALQSCEVLEKSYPGSAVMPDTIDLALNQCNQLQKALDKARGDFDVLNKRRQKALELAPGDQVLEIKNAIEAENQNAKNAIQNALADGSKFFPVFPNNKEALDALQALITSETARWTLLSKTPMRDGITASKNCAAAVAQGDLKTAQEQLALSQKLWPVNAENAKLNYLVEGLAKSQAAAEAAKIKAAAEATKK